MSVTATVAIELSETKATLEGLTPKAWFRPEELIEDYGYQADGTVVSKGWRDASGNGYNLAGTAKWYWQDTTNGFYYPYLYFNGTSYYLTNAATSNFFGTNGVGTVYVFALPDTTNAGAIFRQGRASGNALIPTTTSLIARNYDGTGDDATISTDFVTTLDANVYGWMKDADNVYAACSARQTGGFDTAALASTASGSNTDLSVTFHVGDGYGGSAYYKGALVELIFFAAAHTEAQRQQVLKYFRNRYGLSETRDLTGQTWTTVPDIRGANGLRFSYGLPGTGINDRVATTGQMQFVVMNSAGNSQAKQGYYSPGHANHWTAFDIGAEVRCKVTYGGTSYYKWRGYIDEIGVIPGKYSEQLVNVSCVDWMDMAARAQISGAQVQINKRSDQLVDYILAHMSTVPPSVALGYGADEYASALDNSDQESLPVMTEFQRLANSELGFVYIKGDTQRGGTLCFDPRSTRGGSAGATTPSIQLTETELLNLSTSYARDDIVNEALVQIYPRRTDADATTVLFTLRDEPKILRGETKTFFGPFRESSGKVTRVGASEITTPVAGTDYKLYTKAAGAGKAITSQLTVTYTLAASGIDISVYNAGPYDGYLNLLQCRGRGVYAGESIVFYAADVDSQNKFGKRSMRFDMPYQSSEAVGIDAAYFILNQSKNPQQRLQSVTFLANQSDALMSAALDGEIGSRVAVQETMTGLATADDWYYINAIQLEVSPSGLIRCSWALAPQETDTYWLLGVSGFSELGDTTRLSYGLFSPLWQLSSSVLGTGTYLNP